MPEALKKVLRPVVRPVKHVWELLLLYHDIILCRKRYKKLVENKKKKALSGAKLRVMFVVSEAAKWKNQSLYDLMEESDSFEPIIAISCHGNWWKHPEYKRQFDDSVRYFEDKGMRNVKVASFDTGESKDLRSFSPDIIFYDQPYDWIRRYMPCSVSKYALTCCVPYFVPTHLEHKKHYNLPLLRTLWSNFQINEAMATRLTKLANPSLLSGVIVGVGHPFLDYYYLHKESVKAKDYVIYAPHWSFDHPNNVNTSNISTFLHNGLEILSFAKAHPELNWVFKPHPGLEWRLVNTGVWTQKQVDDYYAAWSEIAINCRDAGYLELFSQSKALITDCGSFLVEYPPCGGALIHLISSTQKNPLHPLNKKLYDSFYKVHNLSEMYEVFDQVLIRNDDVLKEKRLAAVKEYGAGSQYAAMNILKYLEHAFN